MHRLAGWVLSVCAASAGCGGRAAAPAPAPGPAPHGASPLAAPAAPSERQCEELITHAVVLGLDEQVARKVDPPTTEADHEAIRRKLVAELGPGCRALSPGALACAMAATTLAALAACSSGPAPSEPPAAVPDQATRKSSTSNSSVAPGGITPPAPRSP